ncbi:MAG: hypothetical protein SFY56_09230 [Bacteroidota bacterium]|nr:hypothetical protein [Bacteroidota bacterium]
MKVESVFKLSKKISIGFALVMIISSCKKGDTGPQGPQGLQGNQGKQGPPSTYVDIVANYSSSKAMYSFSSYGDIYKDATIVYFKDQANNNAWVQIPFTWYNGTSSPVAYLWAETEKSSCNCNDLVKIYAQKPNAGQFTSAFTVPTTLEFRIVSIPMSFKTMPKDLSYESIKKEYNLKD